MREGEEEREREGSLLIQRSVVRLKYPALPN
jgi:hypothetical protein